MTRGDSVLALAVGRSGLTGEERVRERDCGIPLAGRREPAGMPGEVETLRYKKIAAIPGDDLKLPFDAYPSPPEEAGRRLHRRPAAWSRVRCS